MLVRKIKAIDQNSAAPQRYSGLNTRCGPVCKDSLPGIYKNLQRLICPRMNFAQILSDRISNGAHSGAEAAPLVSMTVLSAYRESASAL